MVPRTQGSSSPMLGAGEAHGKSLRDLKNFLACGVFVALRGLLAAGWLSLAVVPMPTPELSQTNQKAHRGTV